MASKFGSRLRLSPAARLALGLVILTACLLISVDHILGVVPSQAAAGFTVHQRTGENLAIQLAPLVERQDFELIRRLLHTVSGRNPELLSLGLRDQSGTLVAQTENHRHAWITPPDNQSAVGNVIVPINLNMARWGQLELAYRPLAEHTLAWIDHRSVMLSALMGTVGFLLFYLYLRRILQHLNPNLTIPARVRSLFDALAEAVIVIDQQGTIALANAAFRALNRDRDAALTGENISQLEWLVHALGGQPQRAPWARAMQNKSAVTGETITLVRDGESSIKLSVNSAPIVDEGKNLLGCIITLDDLSLIEHMNQQLLDMVAQLKLAGLQIEERNRELKYMADHDPATGALTRRAFFERGQQQFFIGSGKHVEGACIMLDIDHFKSINDRYGHLVGDQALQRVAAILRENVDEQDLVCRYGGEEFCVLIRSRAPRAEELGERLRCVIETTCGPTVIAGEAARITASFGISTQEEGATTLTELINQADQALYLAKASGRNRVCRFEQKSSKHDPLLAT